MTVENAILGHDRPYRCSSCPGRRRRLIPGPAEGKERMRKDDCFSRPHLCVVPRRRRLRRARLRRSPEATPAPAAHGGGGRGLT